MTWKPEVYMGEARPWPDAVTVVRGVGGRMDYVRERTCHVTASSTDGLCSDNPRKYFELSCGHSFTFDGLEMPNFCPNCGAKVVN